MFFFSLVKNKTPSISSETTKNIHYRPTLFGFDVIYEFSSRQLIFLALVDRGVFCSISGHTYLNIAIGYYYYKWLSKVDILYL